MMERRIIRLRDVVHLTSLKKSAIYARIVAGTFPKQVSLDGGAVGWRLADVLLWIDGRPTVDRAAA